jgi:uncharacterized protein (DUF1800 family)
MDRKDFFKTIARKRVPGFNSSRSSLFFFPGLNPYTGNWTTNEVMHLLKRTMFGAKKTDIDHFLGKTMDESVNELLNNITTSSPPVRDYGLIEDDMGMMHDDLSVAQGQPWVNDLNNTSDEMVRGSIDSLRIDSLRKWWAGLIVNQQRSIQEKMILFWHHHYSVQKEEVNNSTLLYRHHNLLRSHVLGNVKQLARDVTIDGAMLIHLNGFLNSKQAPDENYAREFQELFTIGVGNDSHYTENDVIAAARVLTGLRIQEDTMNVYFDSGSHDTASKSFSSFYNNTTVAGSSDGLQELNAFVDMIFATDEAAKFFCRKIYKWFVYYDIDDETETNVIAPLADILKTNNYDVKPMLSALFKSEHFYDTANQACYIKNPFDILAGTLREFNVPFPPYTDYVNGCPVFNSIYSAAAGMQMDLFQPPDVAGYTPYVQDPMNYELWVNSNSLPRRADYTDALVNGNVIDVRAFANYSTNPADPDQLVSDVSSLLLRYPLSDNSKNYIKRNFLLNNSADNTIWTNAWNNNNTTVIKDSLDKMFRFIMNLPEFHLC